MNDFIEKLYNKTISRDNVYAKALAHLLFREVIEDAHSKYNIPQEDIKKMCKDAVNRAALFLEIQKTLIYIRRSQLKRLIPQNGTNHK